MVTAGGARSVALVVVVCACLPPAACTIVYDDEKEQKAQTGTAESHAKGFDASAWVDSVWSSRVLPFFEKDAVALEPVMAAIKQDADAAGQKFGRRADTEGSPWSFAVKGKGKVVSVNTESRAGTMVVAVDGPSGAEEVTLQIGPVVRGTAVRDTLPFVSFGDVTNQIQFAQVSRALNDRAVAAVHPDALALKAAGTPVEFAGAMNLSSSDETLLITPLTLRRAGATGAK